MSGDREVLNLCRPLGRGSPDTRSEDNERRRHLAQRGYIGVSAGDNKVRFAAVGDVHGQFSLLSRHLEAVVQRFDVSLDFVLQVGDIECHRDEDDLASMAAPAKKRTLGDFGRACYQTTEDYLQYPMYFIGGNHECYGWLDSEDHFKTSTGSTDNEESSSQAFLEVAHNMFYLGRAGYLPLRFYEKRAQIDDGSEEDLDITGFLHLGFLSGIYRASEYFHRRPAMTSSNLGTTSNRRWIGFNIYDTQLLLEDEEDDGIDHAKVDELQCDSLSGKRSLTFLLARLLGVKLTQQHLNDASFDILLSKADVEFLTRFIILPSSGDLEGISEKRRNAMGMLPRSLTGIVDILLAGRSEAAIQKLSNRLKRKRAVDVFLTHDWPAVVADAISDHSTSRPIGNPVCTELLEGLKPSVHCCGHMHRGYRKQIKHKTPSGKPSQKTTELCCLGKVGFSGPAAIAVFELDLDTGEITEIGRDPELFRLASLEDIDDD